MYRQKFNNLDNVKAILMQSSKKPLAEIPKEYIENIIVNWDDMHEMNLKIPSIEYKDGIRKENRLYNQIKGKTQQIILENPNIRFIIDAISISEEKIGDTVYKTKTIQCKSFEKTIDEKLVLNEDTIYELYNDDGTGLLNEFELYNKNWKVKYVSDKAKYETGIIRKETNVAIGNNLSYEGVRDILIWSYNNPIVAFSSKTYVNFHVKYKGVQTIYNGNIQANLDFTHTSENLHTGIEKIEAYYCKYEGDYCIKYVISLADGIEKTFYETFCFIDNMNLMIDSIELIYCTGEEIESTYLRRRNIEQGEYKWLDILRDNVSNGYDGLYVEFDTINKEISVYNRSEYGEHHGILLSYNNYIKGINKDVVGDDIVTKVRVTSTDYSIAEVNKFGGEYIYDYSYAYNNDIMTDELKEAWDKYIEFVNTNEGSLVNYREERSSYNKELVKLESEKVAIDYDIQNLQTLQTVLFSQQTESGVDMSAEIEDYYNKIQERKNRFEEVMSAISELNDRMTLLSSEMNSLQEKYKIEACGLFNEEMIEELYDLTIFEEINDDSFSSAKELYENYLYLIYIRNNQGMEFNIDTTGFLENIIIPKGLTWDYYIQIGSFVDLEDNTDIDIEERGLRIISYTLDIKNKTISNLTLTNRDRKVDQLSGFTQLKNIAKRTNAFVNNNKSTWNESKIANQNIASVMSGIDLSKIGVSSSNNGVSIIQNKAGIFVGDSNNYNNTTAKMLRNVIPDEVTTTALDENGNENQIYIGRSLICISNDNFKTCKTAITGNSITADLLKGKIILGEQLEISTENGNFRIGDITSINNEEKVAFGMRITDGDGIDRIFIGIDYEDNKAKMQMYDENGDIVLSDVGRISEIQYEKERAIDLDAPIFCDLKFKQNVLEVQEVSLSLKLYDFVVYSKGLEANGGGILDISGKSSNISINEGTSLIKDKRQILFKGTGVKKDITEFTELEEFEFIIDEETGETAKMYLPPIELNPESTIETNEIKSYDTQEHKHEVNIDLGEVSVTGSIEIESHNHPEIRGIFKEENQKPTNISVYINDELVIEGINEDTDDIDLTPYIPELNGTHTLAIHSETRGIVSAHIYARTLSAWK